MRITFSSGKCRSEQKIPPSGKWPLRREVLDHAPSPLAKNKISIQSFMNTTSNISLFKANREKRQVALQVACIK